MAKGKAAKVSPNGQHPTPALEWRKAREVGELVPLPSGKYARLRPVDLMKLIRTGFIPDLLSPVAAKMVWAEQDPVEIGNSLELAQQYDDLMGLIIPAIFVEPKVAQQDAEPAEDEILIEDIELNDRTAAFNLAIAGVSAMRLFREQQEQHVDALPDSDENGEPSEPDGRD